MIGIAVAVSAGLGAVLRMLVAGSVTRRARSAFPWGTLVVNASGSLVAAVSAGLAVRGALPTTSTLLLTAGFAGGYTTLSTWAWETRALVARGRRGLAALNVVGTVAVCALLAGAGLLVTR